MSSSGITAVNSGPIILRTCLNSSSKTVVLTDYDYPVSSNRVLITSTSGYVIPSDNIYISSITCSTIMCSTINTSTINTYTINASTINSSTINTRTINSSTINTSSINTSAINLSILNGSPYGFSTVVSPPISVIFTNNSLYTVPPNTSSITFTLIGAGGSSNSGGGGGGGGSGVTLTIQDPSNSVFALYPGISNIGSGLGGGMSMLFSVNGNNYTCIAIAGGGGGAGNYGGGGGGSNGIGLYNNNGGRAGNGLGDGGAGGVDTSGAGGDGGTGNNLNGLVYTFPTILVGGGGGAGGYINPGVNGGNGGDGYGGGGGGADNVSGSLASGGGGGNYCYTGGNVTYFNILNGNNGADDVSGGIGGAPGIIIGNYGNGGTVPDDGQPGVIQVDYNSYVNESIYDLIPSTTQTLGSLVSPWSNIFTSSIAMTGIISTSGFKVSGLQTTGLVSNLYYDTITNEITYGVSMAKYKSNIVDLSLDTTSIYNLNPREYDYLDGKHCVGFIAEEVDKVDTMLAAKSGDGKPENINWYGLTTYLVHEMKKLNERVKTLEQVKTLEHVML